MNSSALNERYLVNVKVKFTVQINLVVVVNVKLLDVSSPNSFSVNNLIFPRVQPEDESFNISQEVTSLAQ